MGVWINSTQRLVGAYAYHLFDGFAEGEAYRGNRRIECGVVSACLGCSYNFGCTVNVHLEEKV